MTVVNPKSISGINSITTGSGSDNLLTIHTSDASSTERVRINSSGDVIVGSGITVSPDGHIFSTGITTVGGGFQLSGGDIKVGSGTTLSPDGDVFFTGIATGNGSGLTALNASNLASGTVPTARLGSGTASSSTFLRGDSTFATVTSTTINSNTDNYLITGTGTANTLQGESGLTFDGSNLTVGAGYVSIRKPALAQLDVQHSTTNSYSRIYLAQSSGSGGYFAINKIGTVDNGYTGGANAAQLWSSADAPMIFATNDTERIRIGSEGNLALGGTNTSAYSTQAHFFIGGVGDIYADTGVSSGKSISITNNAYINTSGNWVYRATDKASNIYQYDGIIGFRYVASGTSGNTITWTEAARFDHSGRLLIGTTTYPDGSADGIALRASNGERAFSRGNTATRYQLVFYNPNGNIGRIETSGSSTSYLTSSDYRLKENATAISDGITRLKTLKPYRFNFKADATKTLDGFFAHEVTAVPEAVSGTKDGVDSDNKPLYQAIDQAKLVPLLTAALQEAVAKIEVLETRLNNAGIAT